MLNNIIAGIEFEFYLPEFINGYSYDETYSEWEDFIINLKCWLIDSYKKEDLPEFPYVLKYYIESVKNKNIIFFDDIFNDFNYVIKQLEKYKPIKKDFTDIIDEIDQLEIIKKYIQSRLYIPIEVNKSPKINDKFYGLVIDSDVPFEEGGIELITYPMSLNCLFYNTIHILDFIDKYGYTKTGTALHVHMSVKDRILKKDLDVIKLLTGHNEEKIYKIFTDRTDIKLAQPIKNNINVIYDKYKAQKPTNIYGINFGYVNENHVEFRQMGGSGYQKKWIDIKRIILNYSYNLLYATN